MATKIRLQRHGRKGYAFYSIVIADVRAPRDGKFIEKIGTYNPNTNPATVDLNFNRALYWVEVGAQPTDTVRNILSSEGVMLMKHLKGGVRKGAFDEAAAQAKFDVQIVSVAQLQKAELNDDFIKSLGFDPEKGKTLEDLKNSLSNNLKTQYANRQTDLNVDIMQRAICKEYGDDIEVPEVLVEAETRSAFSSLFRVPANSKLFESDRVKGIIDEIRESLRPNLKIHCLIHGLIQANGLVDSMKEQEGELEAELKRSACAYEEGDEAGQQDARGRGEYGFKGGLPVPKRGRRQNDGQLNEDDGHEVHQEPEPNDKSGFAVSPYFGDTIVDDVGDGKDDEPCGRGDAS